MAWQARASSVLFAVLAGCSTNRASWFPKPDTQAPLVAAAPLDFNWTLSGERQVGPLQVFSDGAHTWMQWRPNQPLPAVLAMQGGEYAVVEYRRQDPYTIMSGVYPSLLFRAGHHWAKATRTHLVASEVRSSRQAHLASANVSTHSQIQPGTRQADRAVAGASSLGPTAAGVSTSVSDPRPAGTSFTLPVTQVTFAVTRADLHLRQALGRWANLSGWRFDPEHWSVDVDIPVSAAASFSDDFVESVQALMASTELSDRPLQPCFYANQVLRVIPMAEACDRTVASPELT